MSKIQIQAEVDFKTVLNAASKLKLSELEAIVKEFNTLLANQRAKSKKKRIKELHNLINQSVINPIQLKRYQELVEKLESGTMTKIENQEFLTLVEEDEKFRNQRVAYMIELSQLRQVPFLQIKEQYSFKTTARV